MEKIVLPKMGQGIETARIIQWFKQEGETVSAGDPLFEIETDKADLEVECQANGTLRKILYPAGETLPLLTVIGYVGSPDEPIPVEQTSEPAVAEQTPVAAAPSQAPAAPAATSSPSSGRIVASPAAKRMAAERGIDLSTLTGTGPRGRITLEDVEAAGGSAKAPAASESIDVGVAGEVRPVAGIRRIIADRMTLSVTTAPQYYLTVDIDMTAAVALRKKLLPKVQSENGSKLSYNDILIKAAAVALGEFPIVNATWKGDTLELLKEINIGIAVNVKRGLIVPVVKNAGGISLAQISAATDDLVSRAMAKKLKPEEMSGGTFTVSNLGGFGIDRFVAIVNPPEAAILAVGAIKDQVIALDGTPTVRPMMTATISFDHRIIDGAIGGLFLARIKQLLEETTPLA